MPHLLPIIYVYDCLLPCVLQNNLLNETWFPVYTIIHVGYIYAASRPGELSNYTD